MHKFFCIFVCLMAVCNAGYIKPALPAQYGAPALLGPDATDAFLGNIALGLPAPTGPIALPIAAPYSAPLPLPALAPAPIYRAAIPAYGAPAYRAAAPILASAPVYGVRPIVAPAPAYTAPLVIPPARIVAPAYSPLPGPVAAPVYANPAIVAAPLRALPGRAY